MNMFNQGGCASSRLDHGLTTRNPDKTKWQLDINSLVPCWGTVRGVKKVISNTRRAFDVNMFNQGGCSRSRLDHGLDHGMELESENGSWTLIRWYRAEVPCEVSKKFASGSRAKL